MGVMKRTFAPRALSLLAVAALALSGCTAAASGDSSSPSPTADERSATVESSQPSSKPSRAAAESDKKASAPKKSATPAPAQPTSSVGPALDGPAAASVLEQLVVKGKAPATGYDRNSQFGNGWKDPDGNKCDARQDILTRDMTNLAYKDSGHCTVASGTLNDAYTGKTINWKVKAGSVDIDHAVALKNAWISGAQQLSQDQRIALANDPLNLIASDSSANRSKGDKNTAEWLPPNKGFRCQYVATQISVKHKYALSVTQPEKNAMAKVLDTCPTQKAAKITPIKPGGKTEAKAPATHAPAAPKKSTGSADTPAGQLVHPGAFCGDSGATGTGKKNGKTYTCKKSDTEDRLRWRA